MKGPIFNNFDIGSYLIFRLYPKEKVFIDGRPEAYPSSFFQTVYIPMQQHEKFFNDQDDTYHFNTIIFSHTDQTPWAKEFLSRIVRNKNWQAVYLDETSIIFLKRNRENEQVNKTKGINLATISFDLSSKDTQSLYQLVNFFATTNFLQQEERILVEVIKREPKNCQALSIMATLLYQRKSSDYATYMEMYQRACQ